MAIASDAASQCTLSRADHQQDCCFQILVTMCTAVLDVAPTSAPRLAMLPLETEPMGLLLFPTAAKETVIDFE